MFKLQIGLGKFEVDLLAGKLLVNGRERVQLVLDIGLLALVEVDLEEP